MTHAHAPYLGHSVLAAHKTLAPTPKVADIIHARFDAPNGFGGWSNQPKVAPAGGFGGSNNVLITKCYRCVIDLLSPLSFKIRHLGENNGNNAVSLMRVCARVRMRAYAQNLRYLRYSVILFHFIQENKDKRAAFANNVWPASNNTCRQNVICPLNPLKNMEKGGFARG